MGASSGAQEVLGSEVAHRDLEQAATLWSQLSLLHALCLLPEVHE